MLVMMTFVICIYMNQIIGVLILTSVKAYATHFVVHSLLFVVAFIWWIFLHLPLFSNSFCLLFILFPVFMFSFVIYFLTTISN